LIYYVRGASIRSSLHVRRVFRLVPVSTLVVAPPSQRQLSHGVNSFMNDSHPCYPCNSVVGFRKSSFVVIKRESQHFDRGRDFDVLVTDYEI